MMKKTNFNCNSSQHPCSTWTTGVQLKNSLGLFQFPCAPQPWPGEYNTQLYSKGLQQNANIISVTGRLKLSKMK